MLDVKIPDAKIANVHTEMSATVVVHERNVMLPVCEQHWAALRTVRYPEREDDEDMDVDDHMPDADER